MYSYKCTQMYWANDSVSIEIAKNSLVGVQEAQTKQWMYDTILWNSLD